MIASLPTDAGEALVAVDVVGLSYAEAAAALHVKEADADHAAAPRAPPCGPGAQPSTRGAAVKSDEQVGTAIAAAARTVHAPQELRERLARAPRRRRALVPRVAFGGALAAVLAALVLLVTGGGPTVQEVAAASLKSPTRPASADAPAGDSSTVGCRRASAWTASTVAGP